MAVVPVTDGVQNSLACQLFTEHGNRMHDEAFLVVLQVLAKVNSVPELVVYEGTGGILFGTMVAVDRHPRRLPSSH